MTSTKESVRPAFHLPETIGKPQFNANSLSALIAEINGAPELLTRDWKQLVAAAFQLSAEQAKSLTDVTPERVNEIQTFLEIAAEYIRQGGKITARIEKLPAESQTPEAAHVVQIELVESPPGAPLRTAPAVRMLRIAHCDAHCRNWKWNSL